MTEQEPEVNFDILDYLKIILNYWWIIGPISILGAGLALFYSFTLPLKFRAQCRLEIYRNEALQVADNITSIYEEWSESPLDRHILHITSSSLNDRIQQDLKKQYPEMDDIQLALFSVSASPVEKAQYTMMDINVDSFNQDASLFYIKKLLEHYEAIRAEESKADNKKTSTALEFELQKLETQIAEHRKKTIQFKAKNNYIFLSTKSDFDQKYIGSLLEQSNQKQFELDLLLPQVNELNEHPENQDEIFGRLVDLLLSSQNNNNTYRYSALQSSLSTNIQDWELLKIDLLKKEAELDTLLEKYKKAHPKVKDIDKEIKILLAAQKGYTKNILNHLHGRIKTLEAERDSYIKRANIIEDSLNNSAEIFLNLESMEKETENLNYLKSTLHEKIVTLNTSNSDKFFTRTIQAPFIIEGAVWPNKPIMVIKGFLASAIISTALIILYFFSKSRFYNFSVITKETDSPCLSTIPHFPANKQFNNPNLFNEISRSSTLAEAYRGLRHSLEEQVESKFFMLTSHGPGEGKTATSMHLALCVSWTGKRTLLIDGDFRRASMRRFFPDADKEGFLDCLKLEQPHERIVDFIHTNAVGSLDYLPCGHLDNHVTEMLQEEKLDSIFQELRKHYDYIIIDTAPVSRVVDTMMISKFVDKFILILRSGKTLPNDAIQAISALPHEKNLGFVINGFKVSEVKFAKQNEKAYNAYGYNYGYGYGYGYKTKY